MSVFTILAGLPAAIQFGGTFLVTTEFEAMMDPSPMVTPLLIRDLLPIQTLSSMTIGLASEYRHL
jgi:hypothetical protein